MRLVLDEDEGLDRGERLVAPLDEVLDDGIGQPSRVGATHDAEGELAADVPDALHGRDVVGERHLQDCRCEVDTADELDDVDAGHVLGDGRLDEAVARLVADADLVVAAVLVVVLRAEELVRVALDEVVGL